MSRHASVAFSIFSYIVAFAAAWILYSYAVDFPILIRIAIADLTGTSVIFLFSMAMNNSSMYDPYWSVKPLVIASFYFFPVSSNGITLVEITAFSLIFLYALRLTSNFYRDWPGLSHEDWRYRKFRIQFPKAYWIVSFFGIHFFPTLMVFLGCLPMIIIFDRPVSSPFLAATGFFILLASIVLAFAADEQLRRFRKIPENAGKTMNIGLWSKSRHPNYLGEILTWWGLFILALSSGWQYWWTGLGALFITLMFVFISIPLMESHSLGRRTDYRDYREKVPFLFPLKLK